MELINKHQTLMDEYGGKIKIIHNKWKEQREKLQQKLAETAREQAIEILENDNIDTIGNPENLYKKIRDIKLEYNRIIVQQDEELDIIVKEYYKKLLEDKCFVFLFDLKSRGGGASSVPGLVQLYCRERIKEWNDPNKIKYHPPTFEQHLLQGVPHFDWEKHLKIQKIIK